MDSLILEYVNHSTYNMKYNLMDMNIYMGVGSLFLMFAAFSLCYLGCQLRVDIKRKFLSDDPEDEEGGSKVKESLNQKKYAINDDDDKIEEIDLKED